MGRLVWVGVGAVGGIYVYRRGEHVVQSLRQTDPVRLARAAVLGRREVPLAPAAEQASAGLRVGRFRITRSDEPLAVVLAQPGPSPQLLQAAIMDAGAVDGVDVIDITARARAREILRRKAR